MSDVSSPRLTTGHLLRLLAREAEQLGDETGGAVRRRLDVLDVLVGRIARPMRLQQQIGKADDRRQHVVEVVRDAARELADGLHLLRLRDAAFERLLLGRVDDVERRRGAARYGGQRRHVDAARKLLLLAGRDLDRLDMAAPGQRLEQVRHRCERALRARPCRQSASAASTSCAGRPSSTMRMKAGVAVGDTPFGVERRDAERRRLEELRSAHVLMAAIDEARRQRLIAVIVKPRPGWLAGRLDEQRQRARCGRPAASDRDRRRADRHPEISAICFKRRAPSSPASSARPRLRERSAPDRIAEPMLEGGVDMDDGAVVSDRHEPGRHGVEGRERRFEPADASALRGSCRPRRR